MTPSNVATEVVVPDEQEEGDSYTPEATRCPSRVSNKSTPAGVSLILLKGHLGIGGG